MLFHLSLYILYPTFYKFHHKIITITMLYNSKNLFLTNIAINIGTTDIVKKPNDESFHSADTQGYSGCYYHFSAGLVEHSFRPLCPPKHGSTYRKNEHQQILFFPPMLIFIIDYCHFSKIHTARALAKDYRLNIKYC